MKAGSLPLAQRAAGTRRGPIYTTASARFSPRQTESQGGIDLRDYRTSYKIAEIGALQVNTRASGDQALASKRLRKRTIRLRQADDNTIEALYNSDFTNRNLAISPTTTSAIELTSAISQARLVTRRVITMAQNKQSILSPAVPK